MVITMSMCPIEDRALKNTSHQNTSFIKWKNFLRYHLLCAVKSKIFATQERKFCSHKPKNSNLIYSSLVHFILDPNKFKKTQKIQIWNWSSPRNRCSQAFHWCCLQVICFDCPDFGHTKLSDLQWWRWRPPNYRFSIDRNTTLFCLHCDLSRKSDLLALVNACRPACLAEHFWNYLVHSNRHSPHAKTIFSK